ncbi:MAG: hypothetical protein U0031_00595 [Thermomicrobiales bacterium]
MRRHQAGIVACLLIAALMLAGSLLPSLQLLTSAIGAPQAISAPMAAANSKNAAKHKGKQKKQPDGQQGAGKTPADLDASRIAGAKARTVEAMQCGGLIEIRAGDRTYCTHGQDPPMPSLAGRSATAAAELADSGVLCIDDGQSGPRVQMVYVHRSDKESRYEQLLPTFRRLAAEMDLIFAESAAKTGDPLHLRMVTDANCQVDIVQIGVPPATIANFGGLINRLADAGYDRLDRKYLMMVDDRALCGVGSYYGGRYADDPNTEAHDFTGYAQIDTPCWDAGTMAHELSHTLGAVQYSAPHTSRGGHCIDEWDVMCYSDSPYYPKMQTLCKDGSQDFRLDCNNDDYFAANPKPGSYLARHWNSADSQFLTAGPQNPCVDARAEPDYAYWYWFWDTPMIQIGSGASDKMAFCQEAGDTDWRLFKAQPGKTYQIETSNLAPGVDTQLVLYRAFNEQGWDDMGKVATNDNRNEGDASSAIVFTSPGKSTYLIGVSDVNKHAGVGNTYTLSIRETTPPRTLQMNAVPGRGAAGGNVDIEISGLARHSGIRVWLVKDGHVWFLGTDEADNTGDIDEEFDVPAQVSAGAYTIEAQADDGSAASVPFTVTKAGGGAKPHRK